MIVPVTQAQDPDVEIPSVNRDELLKESNENEVEVSRWNSKREQAFGASDVWMKDGSIEGKVPSSAMKKKSNKPKID